MEREEKRHRGIDSEERRKRNNRANEGNGVPCNYFRGKLEGL